MMMRTIRAAAFGVVLFCAGAAAKSSDATVKGSGKHDVVDVDPDAFVFSKQDYKECYKANPGCTGQCLPDENEPDTLVCVAPVDAEPGYDICGGDKKGNGNWAVWEDGDAACTCAEGYVTSAKVRDMYAGSSKLPPASKLCTYQCAGEVECTDGNGPLACFCLGDDGEGAEDYISKKDASDAEKTLLDDAKTAYNTAVDDAKSAYETAKSDAKDAYETAKSAAKQAYEASTDDDAKQVYKNALDTIKEEYQTVKSDAKDVYETAKEDAKSVYDDAKEAIKKGETPEDDKKAAAPTKA